MSINKIGYKIATTVATAAAMIGITVIAKVGYEFFTIKVLPTASQFGAKCGSALVQNGLVFGASATIALAIDLIFDEILIPKVLARKGLADDETAQIKGYFIKRAVTVLAVVGFAVIAGASAIVPTVTLVVLIAKDILRKTIESCKTEAEEPKTEEIIPKEMTEEEKFNQIQKKFNEIEMKLLTKLTTKERSVLCTCVVYLSKSIKDDQNFNSLVLEKSNLEGDAKKRIQRSNQIINKINSEQSNNIESLDKNVFQEKINQILNLDLNASFLHNFEFNN